MFGAKILRIIKNCRVCGFKNLTPILSLGEMYISDFVKKENKAEKAPLDLLLCNANDGGCGLLQLKHTISHEQMYRNYWYRSGMNKTMTEELNSIAQKVQLLVNFKAGDFVMDIGANDGTLLRGYSNQEINRIGFEPARNLKKYNKVGTTKVINDFFNYATWKKTFGKAKVKAITAIAMFYDLDYPNKFVGDIVKCLDKDGVFIIQMSYLPTMLSQNAFDNICHEHVEYYSLFSLENLLKRHNLEVFDVELNNVNGGSYRIYMKHKDNKRPVTKRVVNLRKYEKKLGLNDRKIYDQFVKRINNSKDQLTTFVKNEIANGKIIHVYGASTKGNTLLQFYNLDASLIKAAAERNTDKWGKKTIGTLIPIISEEESRKQKPDYFLVLPWHFFEEFKEREKKFLEEGGKFILPLPKFKIV